MDGVLSGLRFLPELLPVLTHAKFISLLKYFDDTLPLTPRAGRTLVLGPPLKFHTEVQSPSIEKRRFLLWSPVPGGSARARVFIGTFELLRAWRFGLLGVMAASWSP